MKNAFITVAFMIAAIAAFVYGMGVEIPTIPCAHSEGDGTMELYWKNLRTAKYMQLACVTTFLLSIITACARIIRAAK